MEHLRICIETLLTSGQRRTPIDQRGTHAVDRQFPVSEWMEIDEWFHAVSRVHRERPVEKLGLMIGHQEKNDEISYRLVLEERTEALRKFDTQEKIMAHFDAVNAARESRYADMLRRIDEFLASFDFVAYGLREALGV